MSAVGLLEADRLRLEAPTACGRESGAMNLLANRKAPHTRPLSPKYWGEGRQLCAARQS